MAKQADVAEQSERDPEKLFTFPQGIPGFEEYTSYYIFHRGEGEKSAYSLESAESPTVTFTLVDPTLYGLNFSLELNDEEQELLQAKSHENIAVLLMLSKKEGEDGKGGALNANIAGPILLNIEARVGMQKVITKSHVDINVIQE